MEGILSEKDSNWLANSIDHRNHIEHYEKLNISHEMYNNALLEREMIVVKTYSLVPYKDGNMWCVLLGENIQEGICGFGSSPINAIKEFNKAFLSK